MKDTMSLISIGLGIILTVTVILGLWKRDENITMYNLANEYMQKGKYEYAIEGFEKISDFKDSKEKITMCYVLQGYEVCPNCGCKLELRGEK